MGITTHRFQWILGLWLVALVACGGDSGDGDTDNAGANGGGTGAVGFSGAGGSESFPGGSTSGGTGGVSAGGSTSGGTGGPAGGSTSGGTGGPAGGSTSGGTSGVPAGGVSAGGSGGETGASGGDGGEPAVTKYEACAAYINAQCNRRRYECAGRAAVADPCPSSVASCPDFLFAEGSNRTVEEMLACADEWRRYPCEKANRLEFPGCGSPGQRELGEPCVFGSQCASKHCRGSSVNPNCAICVPVGELGDACHNAEPPIACPNGTECTGDGCAIPPVFNSPAGSECEDSRECAPGHWCSSDPNDGVDRCQRIAELGENCTGSCEAGTYCAEASSKCEPAPAPGEPCASGNRCGLGAMCNRDALPEPLCERRMAIGEPCIPMPQAVYYPSNCALDLMCECTDPSCQAGTCFAPGNMGEACDEPTVRCVPGTECQLGVCTPVESQGLADACNP